MRKIYKMRTRIIVYFGICFVPLGFILMMIGGALENVRLTGLELGTVFVIAGTIFLGLVLTSVIVSPFITLVLIQRDSMLMREIRFLSIPVRKQIFNYRELHVRNERRGVFASDTLATHETIQLKAVSENGVERTVVGDLGRILFGVDLVAFGTHHVPAP